ncbi:MULTISPECIES: DUF932 domain-containing protein [Oscillospiraceae]|uniref:DUF932 domain-containing protein n=2 Tax=Pseudobacteroides cellulosolvens TaxID=35825 RepID=A0A0L6JTL5_9FIRM|nr:MULTISPECIES: DUF932 domain-containing protein [Oscillospiraceae]KNY29064.1 Protein of unknown function DUF932 [Pseudobacteroides cellulosolvens ATCC 35603 = DSM 2933]
MKTGKTINELARELNWQNIVKRDFLVDTPKLLMDVEEDTNRIRLRFEDPVTGVFDDGFSITRLAHRQIGETLEIPAKYYDRMLEENPELLIHNTNSWFREQPSRRMVRTLDGHARAFLSDRYRRIDNYDIAQAVLPIIREMPDARVESCELTENRMYLKVVNPRLEAEVKKGDIVQAGIVISNSEVGLGAVSVQPLVYRLVCLNGMTVNDLGQRRYHAGRMNQANEDYSLFSDETLKADDKVFMLKVQDLVRTAVDEVKFKVVVDRLKETTEVKITGHVPQVVELASREFGITANEEKGILQHLIEGGDLSLYGFANAVTRQSQEVESYDRASELEGIGWQIINMPKDLWARVNSEVV